ncbi:hypothetical protein ABT173_29385 [Streptomyces sp. NPDC001795]|uniref:hypothetical protein n=1 Tax=unclassified Streptomyces TaxID=2593676 RepID=UPI0033220735
MEHTQVIRCERRRWVWGLAAIAAACCLLSSVVFSPGFMSPDSLDQLGQAQGKEPLTDWHPPVLALVWRALIALTGTPATMALLQCAILWAALWVFAACVWDLTGSRPKSLAVMAIGLAPHVLTFAGVVWKDVHMAFALLAACAVGLLGRRLPPGRPRLRWTLLAVGALLLAYAVLVRKNAVFAVIPVFVMLLRALWPTPGLRVWLASSLALFAAVVVPGVAISAFAQPQRTGQSSQIMLDDLVHVLSVDEVEKAAEAAATTSDFRMRLHLAAQQCEQTQTLSDTYFNCYPRDERAGAGELALHADELRSMWISQIPRHLPQYVQYRLQLFSLLLFKTSYQYQFGITRNSLGLTVTHPRLEAALQTYVLGALRDLPLLFAGWLWLAVALFLSIRPGGGALSLPVRALGMSSLAYVLGYLPIIPATDFRYLYWPALAGTLGLLLSRLQRGTTAPTPETPAVQTGQMTVRQSTGPRSDQLTG